MRLTLLSSTHKPTYQYGVYYIAADGTIRMRTVQGTHRTCVEWIAAQPNAESYGIARRNAENYTWDFDWYNS